MVENHRLGTYKLTISLTIARTAMVSLRQKHSKRPSWSRRIEVLTSKTDRKRRILSPTSTAEFAFTMTNHADTCLQVTAFTRMRMINTSPFLLNYVAVLRLKTQNNMRDRKGGHLTVLDLKF